MGTLEVQVVRRLGRLTVLVFLFCFGKPTIFILYHYKWVLKQLLHSNLVYHQSGILL